MTIDFFTEKKAYTLRFPATIKRWLGLVARDEKVTIKEVVVIFCDDAYVRKLNREHLHHDYETDVITFDWSEIPGTLHGDIYISIDRVKENATTYGVTFPHELLRVIVHGVLHLIGYNDLSKEEKVVMRQREDRALAMEDARRWLSLEHNE